MVDSLELAESSVDARAGLYLTFVLSEEIFIKPNHTISVFLSRKEFFKICQRKV